jgi:hypothetical protein
MNAMMYRNYVAAVEFDAEDRIFIGRAVEVKETGAFCNPAVIMGSRVRDALPSVQSRFAWTSQACALS